MNDDRHNSPQQIPFKFRSISALLHAIFAIPMGLNIGFYLWMGFIAASRMDPVSFVVTIIFYFFCISLPLIIVLPTIVWVSWLVTKKINPFVDLHGRDVLNYTLSNSIAIALTIVMMIAISKSFTNIEYVNKLILIAACFVPISFSVNSIVSGIFAFRGYRLNSFLSYPFVR
jgi:uncharacterized Tic20 family protein